jgi:hypothetical protein
VYPKQTPEIPYKSRLQKWFYGTDDQGIFICQVLLETRRMAFPHEWISVAIVACPGHSHYCILSSQFSVIEIP